MKMCLMLGLLSTGLLCAAGSIRLVHCSLFPLDTTERIDPVDTGVADQILRVVRRQRNPGLVQVDLARSTLEQHITMPRIRLVHSSPFLLPTLKRIERRNAPWANPVIRLVTDKKVPGRFRARVTQRTLVREGERHCVFKRKGSDSNEKYSLFI